jgi:23S rRNA (cytidine1920-2'-O)/16S rRNA (cytidine1409-2'-O)-methyltransferase
VPTRRRTPFVSLAALLHARHPQLGDPDRAIREHRVLVDDRFVDNPRARVRRDASVRVIPRRTLRGDAKLSAALAALGVDVTAAVAVDIGAAAGGFTTALLRHGASRVYAVDVGFGQLTGTLRNDERVVNLERTNVAALGRTIVPERVDVVTMDVSYAPIAEIVGSLATVWLAPDARLLALVKPTFELGAARLVTARAAVREAVSLAAAAIDANGWTCRGVTLPAVTGAGGAVEAFILADRRTPPHAT